MGKATHEGDALKAYFRSQNISQDAAAEMLGYKTRQGLTYHFAKEKLDYEFKMLLREKGINIFNDNGKLIYTEKAETKSTSTPNGKQVDNNFMSVPLVGKYAYAGYTTGYGDDEYIENLPHIPFIVDKEYKGCYMAFEVRGDSMDDGVTGSYKEGYIVLGREVPNELWRDKLHIRKWKNFVVVTKNDGILIKQISHHDTATGTITLHSLNPLYADIQMRLDNVAQLFNVIKFIGE